MSFEHRPDSDLIRHSWMGTWGGALLLIGVPGLIFLGLTLADGGPYQDIDPEHKMFYGDKRTAPAATPASKEPEHVLGAYYPEDHPEYQAPQHWDPLLLAVAGGGTLAVVANGLVLFWLSRRRREEEEDLKAFESMMIEEHRARQAAEAARADVD